MAFAKSKRVLGVESLERREVMAASLAALSSSISAPYGYSGLVATENYLFAGAVSYYPNQTGLIRSDGTTTGTIPLLQRSVANLTPAEARVYFTVGYEVWTSDGTTTGTTQLKLSSGFPEHLTTLGSDLYFTVPAAANKKTEFWKSDGTIAGTIRLAEFDNPSGGTYLQIAAVEGRVYLSRSTGLGADLWVSDGTAAGTRLVRHFEQASDNTKIAQSFAFGANLFFLVGTKRLLSNNTTYSLWRTDGTDTGTKNISGYQEVVTQGDFYSPADGAAFNGAFYLSSYASGIYRIPADSNAADTIYPQKLNGFIEKFGNELWINVDQGKKIARIKSDGTLSVNPVENGNYFYEPLEFEGRLYYRGAYSTFKSTDGKIAGTVFNPDYRVTQIAEFKNELYAIHDDRFGRGLARVVRNFVPTASVAGELTVERGSAAALPAKDFIVSDSDDTPDRLSIRIVTPPKFGRLVQRSYYPEYKAKNLFSLAALQRGEVSYSHFGGDEPLDSFTFEVIDSFGSITQTLTYRINTFAGAETRIVVKPDANGVEQIVVLDGKAGGKNDRLYSAIESVPAAPNANYGKDNYLFRDEAGGKVTTNVPDDTYVTGRGTSQLRIAAFAVRTAKSMRFDLRAGDDRMVVNRGKPLHIKYLPITADLGSGSDSLEFADAGLQANRWVLNERTGGRGFIGTDLGVVFTNTERLASNAGPDTFELSTNLPSDMTLDGGGGSDRMNVFYEGDITLSDTKMTLTSGATVRNFPLRSIENVTLSGDAKANTFDASLFSGSTTMYGYGGNDLLRGGKGRDRIYGGFGADVLLGGDGNDTLYGEADRDLLIGGRGADELFGGDGDDILLAGSTVHDQSAAALRALMAAWNTNESYEKRIERLTTTGVGPDRVRLNRTSAVNDGYRDRLGGGFDRDWYFAEMSVTNPAIDATDAGGETVLDL